MLRQTASRYPPTSVPFFFSAAGAEALFRGGACRLLTSLDLSFCGLDAAAAAHVAAGLLCAAPAATDSATDGARAGSPLQSLSLEGNPLGPGGVAEIASALAGAGGSLRDLNFAGTDAGDEGVRALVRTAYSGWTPHFAPTRENNIYLRRKHDLSGGDVRRR